MDAAHSPTAHDDRTPPLAEPPAIDVLGVRVHVLDAGELLERVHRLVSSGDRHLVTYVNPHTLNVAQRDGCLREAYRRSTITYCDGQGVVWGARALGWRLPARLPAADIVEAFCAHWARHGTRVFLVGGHPGVADDARRELVGRHPGLVICGCAHGYFARCGPDERALLERIASANPDILLVGMGTPTQERWVLDQWETLPASVIWPVGALFDFASGRVPRAPDWMRSTGLEWLFRLGLEPRRLFARYAIGNPVFALRVLRQRRRRP